MPKKILIAEDDHFMANLTRKKFEEIGYEVTIAPDGSEAIKQLLDSPPDLVMLDLIMPGVDGVGVLQFIRAHETLSELPVVVVSSSDYLSGVALAAKNAGATHFFNKGESRISFLVDEIKKILQGETDAPYSPKATKKEVPAFLKKGATAKVEQPEGPRILVTDDDHFMLRILSFLLKEAGYAVETASDGLDALKIASDTAPALMILDGIMPEMGGLEVLDHWSKSEKLRKIPVIMITAEVDSALRAEAIGKGAAAFLNKPFTPQKLLEEIDRHIAVT